jgi:hypothetical protein
MKNSFCTFGFVVILCLIGNPVSAQTGREKKPFELQATASNLGFGGSIGYYLSQTWMVGGGVSGMKISQDNVHSNDNNYDNVNHSLMTLQIHGRYYPNITWCETFLGGLYIQAGMAGRTWKFETTEKNIAQDGVKAVVDFSNVAGLGGLGFDWILKWGLSFGVGFNFLVGPNPTTSVTGGPTASASDIDNTRSHIEKHHYMGALTTEVLVSVGYNF